jgi:uncharacterized OB-fold protein
VAEYKKPIPQPSAETRPYWEACKRHELRLPYCTSCAQFFFYPRFFCPSCFSSDIEWRKVSGMGTLYTYAIQYRPNAPGFEPPYVTAVVELEEGPRLMTNLVDVEADPEQIQVGMPLEVTFEDVSDEISMPKFRPAGR